MLEPHHPEIRSAPRPLAAMVGENLTYDLAFLWFDGLAEAQLTLEQLEEKDTYRAVLEARTLGVASWLTGNRVQRYVSVMERTAEGRLRTRFHESQIVKGQGEDREARTKRYSFDFEARRVRYQRAKEGKFYKEKFFPMEGSKPPSDILTAFYNFRAGYFGPVRVGGTYVIPAFEEDGTSEIRVEILTSEECRNLSFVPEGELVGRVTVDEEVFDTGGGKVYVWFDALGTPRGGVVEDVIGLGNVRGTLRN